MSTEHFFVCVCHDPPLYSDEQISNHYDNAYYRRAVELAGQRPLPPIDWDRNFDSFERSALTFLRQHPNCVLHIEDEYGLRRDLNGKELTGPRGEPLVDPFSDKALMKRWDEQFIMLTFLELGSRREEMLKSNRKTFERELNDPSLRITNRPDKDV